ncbi:MAG: DnaJ domain-containing protein [Bauldia sp.]|nr:DnaJ domain-containing protein [Bauldia sp.]
MIAIFLGTLALAALLGLGMIFVRSDPRLLARVLPVVAGLAGLVAFALVSRLWYVIIPGAIIALLASRFGLPQSGSAGDTGEAGGSDVRSIYFAMHLDHATGEMDGTVIAGRFFSKKLSSLSEAELLELLEEVGDNEESRSLLEAYLDRRMPAWRDDIHADAGEGPAGAPRAGGMTEQEAYEILGLPAGAGEAEIRAAHRRLMRGVHPDQGGSTVLAAKINEAKDRLLGRHR